MRILSFPPIADENIRILILGTMPGAKSLAINEYYGHAGNQFWKIMFKLFGKDYSNDYSIKCSLLLSHGIGLWDVLKSCEREGSSDLAIENTEPNDFRSFFKDHKKITHLCFNGQNAEYYFNINVKSYPNYNTIVLPSTSPANTWQSFEGKLELWSAIKEIVSGDIALNTN